jgi:predicted nucleic acid-binding protein
VILADTSAIYALLDRADPNHRRARLTLEALHAAEDRLVTHGYVVVEVVALVQRRLGVAVVRRFVDDMLPIIEVVHVDEQLHAEALEGLLAAGQRDVSLVDRTSFLVMRRYAIGRAFAFDADFAAEGFELLP